MMGPARFMALRTKDEIGRLQGLMAPTAIPTSFRYSCLWYGTHSICSNPFVFEVTQIIAIVSESPSGGPPLQLHNHIVPY
jgi:hypothetical protein